MGYSRMEQQPVDRPTRLVGASWLALIPLCLCMTLAACASQPLTVTREPATIRFISSESCAPLAEALVSAYEESHPWVSVEIDSTNASLVEEAVRAGEVDLALGSWPREDAAAAPLWSTPFVSDALAVIVHSDLPMENVDLGRLHEIFRGRVQEWEGALLGVVIREDGSDTRVAFDRVVLRDREPALTAVVLPSSRAVIDYVANTPNAIGYVSVIRLTEADLEWVRIVSIDHVAPTRDAVGNGRYVLGRQLVLAAHSDPVGPARDLAQWILGPEGQIVAARVGTW